MNIAYRFLEQRRDHQPVAFHPFIDMWSHHATTADLQREVAFPDQLLDESSVLMVEGDFTRVFHAPQQPFDVVVTHFFIDTARNLITYLETIYHALEPGGFWINSGPLLYGSGPFVQLSLDEIVAVAEDMGFEFLETSNMCGEQTLPGKKIKWMPAIYGSSERALNMNGYRVQNWVARRR